MLTKQEILDLLPSHLRADFSNYPAEDQEALLDNVRTIVAKVEGKENTNFFTRRVAPLIAAGVNPREALSAARRSHPAEFEKELVAKVGRSASGTAKTTQARQELRTGGENVPQSGFFARRVAPLIKAGNTPQQALSAARKRYPREFNAEQAAKLGR